MTESTRVWVPSCIAGVLFFAIAMITCDAAAVPVAVRFPEGITHGFLLDRSMAGDVIGQGELTQIVKLVPAFVQFEGPLQLMGPTLRIELISPRVHVNIGNEKYASNQLLQEASP
jgi:hypothetical protein